MVQEHVTLQWRHNERDGVSNHQPHDCLLNLLFKAQIKENIQATRHWPLWGEFTGDRWIPRTKGRQRGKCFHLMTSPWSQVNATEPLWWKVNTGQITVLVPSRQQAITWANVDPDLCRHMASPADIELTWLLLCKIISTYVFFLSQLSTSLKCLIFYNAGEIVTSFGYRISLEICTSPSTPGWKPISNQKCATSLNSFATIHRTHNWTALKNSR